MKKSIPDDVRKKHNSYPQIMNSLNDTPPSSRTPSPVLIPNPIEFSYPDYEDETDSSLPLTSGEEFASEESLEDLSIDKLEISNFKLSAIQINILEHLRDIQENYPEFQDDIEGHEESIDFLFAQLYKRPPGAN